MTTNETPTITVVLAAIEGASFELDSLARFADEVGDSGEVVVVDGTRGGISLPESLSDRPIRVVRGPRDSLAPELWRIGFDRSDSEFVAFSTVQMAPSAGWVASLLAPLEDREVAAAGGPIQPAGTLSRTDQALYLLRYAHYSSAAARALWYIPPGDNSLYRRACVRGLEALSRAGFWEVEACRELRERGYRFAAAPGAVVTYRGGCRLAAALLHRFAHAWRYGAGRAIDQSRWASILRSSAWPMVPPVLMARIARAVRGRDEPLRRWAAAMPTLVLLLIVWSLGEAAGMHRRPVAE